MSFPEPARTAVAPSSTGRGHGGRLLGGIAAALLVAALAACGSSDPATPSPSSSPPASSATPSGGSTASASASAAPSPSGAVPPTGTPALTTPTIAPGGATTLTGTVEAGVESGCIVLVGADGAVLANLIGIDSATAPMGAMVEVSGKFQTDMMTTCQQGEPFAVATVVEQ